MGGDGQSGPITDGGLSRGHVRISSHTSKKGQEVVFVLFWGFLNSPVFLPPLCLLLSPSSPGEME